MLFFGIENWMNNGKRYLEDLVIRIHRRNSGLERVLDLSEPILSGKYQVDSMDLAEIVATIQKDFGLTLFEDNKFPRVWGDVVEILDSHGS